MQQPAKTGDGCRESDMRHEIRHLWRPDQNKQQKQLAEAKDSRPEGQAGFDHQVIDQKQRADPPRDQVRGDGALALASQNSMFNPPCLPDSC
jgi:hypothetical protein